MVSRSIYNLKINTIYMYDIPFDRSFLQLSNGIRHVMPSTDTKPELTAKASIAQPVSQPAVYANGLKLVYSHSHDWNFGLRPSPENKKNLDVLGVWSTSIFRCKRKRANLLWWAIWKELVLGLRPSLSNRAIRDWFFDVYLSPEDGGGRSRLWSV
jgi:hypothetical protein